MKHFLWGIADWNSFSGAPGQPNEKHGISFTRIRKRLWFIQLIVVISIFPVFAQQEQQKEYVQVVNVELILRVLKDGSPVGGLKKNDFSLYEDGKKGEINGFFEIHRRMATADDAKQQPRQARLYLLFFWADNPAADVDGVLSKFFSTIYREGDRVILSTPSKTFELLSRPDIGRITVSFLEQWRREAKNKNLERVQFIEYLNQLFEDFIHGKYNLASFLGQYSSAIQGYQFREFSPDMKALDAMARSLLPIENDKFALVFFQRGTLPLLDISKLTPQCFMNDIPQDVVDELEKAISKIEVQAISVSDIRGLSEQLKTLFIQANTQFHLLFLSPDRSEGKGNVSSAKTFTKSEEIISNWDQVMREISNNTGGRVLDGDRMVDTLDQVASFEDIYYHITYVPREQKVNQRQIDIRVNQPGMTVIHGRMLEMKGPPPVKIGEISATSQLIRFAVADFYSISKQGVPTGSLNVYVTGSQADDKPPRLLLSQEIETAGTVELPFAFPKPGAWNLELRVIDQITGQQAMKKVKVEIAADIPADHPDGDPDPALIAILAKAAVYAEKLKTAAFHFLCQEEVTEDLFTYKIANYNALMVRGEKKSSKRTYWTYDYQIIGNNGKISERRILLRKNRTKVRREQPLIETRFYSLYSFFMPATILAREKQPLYRYRLLGKNKVNKTPVWHIGATRRDPSLLIPVAEVWVSEKDGAVLKIRIDQTSIIGFEKRVQKAIKGGFVPEVTTIHEYDVEKNEIRFPSKTTFIEIYNLKRNLLVSLERSRTYFEYKDYRFFSVTTNVMEKIE